jgi:hypothetical protein
LRSTSIEAWDLNQATLIAEMDLPVVYDEDQWVGMAFERREESADRELSGHLRNKSVDVDGGSITSVYLHMPLDTVQPQLWSFHLQENHEEGSAHFIFTLPECDGVAMK